MDEVAMSMLLGRLWRRRIWLTVLAVLATIGNGSNAAAQNVDFTRDIEPVFHERCYLCHGPAQAMNGLRLDRKDRALEGGYSGAVILPGDSAASKLIERVTSSKDGHRMPPVGEALSAQQVAALKAWIDGGAAWPERAPAPELSEQEKAIHWSFRAPRRTDPPDVQARAGVRNAIDRFILARLEAEKVQPSPEAARAKLIRRVSLDLTGLLPTPEQVERFVADESAGAYERLVDQLLDSPHYGERQAIHWLDAARYADSEGHEKDLERPHGWRWRRWVIEAFNGDQPFDQFTVDQLAGDLLPNATIEQRVATGFLRNGVKNREAGVKPEENRFEESLDRINTVGAVWLGLTVGCTQCHDHKFDPLSQKEFYEMFAVFNNAVERDILAPIPGQRGPYLRTAPDYAERRERILRDNGVDELQASWRKDMIAAMEHPRARTDWDHLVTGWRALVDRAEWKMLSDPRELSQIERDEITDYFLRTPGPEAGKDDELRTKLKQVGEQLKSLEESRPDIAHAYTLVEREKRVPTHIALRGDWRAPGLEVQPGTPAMLPKWGPRRNEPGRVAFARWLVSADNPLTARVTVNRMWQELFGEGLVRTSNDFGTQGEKPSHPELLDWLATEFVGSGWSRKHMLRLMVTSATYRQKSDERSDIAERDPVNRWLARQNRLRLPAELIRDAALRASGLLDPTVGGRSIRPPQPAGVNELMYSKKDWNIDTGPERYRRGLYVWFQRTAPYPMLMNFDSAANLVATVKRERSNTPLQALNLLNDPVFVEAAQALAVRVIEEEAGFDERVNLLFRLCLNRPPGAAEKDRAATLLERQRQILRQQDATAEETIAPYVPEGNDRLDVAAWTGLAHGMLNLDEFITRE